jgi:alpha-galactosidase
MLEVGNGGMTIDEEKTHFALWALAKAPLIIGCDLMTVRSESLAILKNQHIINVNQDPNSKQATCMVGCDWWSTLMRYPQAYATTVTGGDTVAVIVNWREVVQSEFTFNFEELGVVPSSTQKVEITDLWTGQVVGTFGPKQIVGVQNIPGHGNFVYKFSIIDNE